MFEQAAVSRRSLHRLWVVVTGIFFVLATWTISSPAAAQQVAVFVNGSPITTYDIEQRSKFIQLSSQKAPSRQEVMDDLINEKIKIQEAQRYGMDAPDAEVERGVTNMANRAGLNITQFTQVLASRGIELGTIKSRLRADIAWNQLVRARYPATLQIEDSEVRDALTKKDEEAAVAYDYSLRPIIFVIPKGASPAFVESRVREAEALRARFENCTDGIAFARALKDVAVRDLVKRTSADLPPTLREVLNNTSIGKLSKPEVTGQGVEVFALCERKENKTDTPEKRNARQELFISRFEVQSKRYLNEVRRGSMIEYK